MPRLRVLGAPVKFGLAILAQCPGVKEMQMRRIDMEDGKKFLADPRLIANGAEVAVLQLTPLLDKEEFHGKKPR